MGFTKGIFTGVSVGIIIGLFLTGFVLPPQTEYVSTSILGVYFSPDGGCEQEVTYWIDRANSTIYVAIYSFTLDSIGDALIDAYDRGIQVLVVFESSQISQYSEYQKLSDYGISAKKDSNPSLMHNKVMIVDGHIVITGSYNWSKNAEERNNENLIVIKSEYIASLYEEEFWNIWNK